MFPIPYGRNEDLKKKGLRPSLCDLPVKDGTCRNEDLKKKGLRHFIVIECVLPTFIVETKTSKRRDCDPTHRLPGIIPSSVETKTSKRRDCDPASAKINLLGYPSVETKTSKRRDCDCCYTTKIYTFLPSRNEDLKKKGLRLSHRPEESVRLP